MKIFSNPAVFLVKTWVLGGALALILAGPAGASPQSDVIAKYERLAAMLEVGVARADIQTQLVDLKLAIGKLKESGVQPAFAEKAADLLESIRLGFLLSDTMPTKKSGVALANESLAKDLPELKALAGAGGKKKK